MKQIGIVGFFSSDNYGAILQAVALQRKIEEIGYQATYLNYFPPAPVGRLKKLTSALYYYVRLLFGYSRRKQRTDAFRKKFLETTRRLATYEDASRVANDFDLFIAGSDQIWNPRWLEVSHGYYLLNFVGNKPRFSYASSFGVENIPEKYRSVYKDALEKFLFISIREGSGVRILENMGIRGAKNVLDPTFLLSREEWSTFFAPEPLIKEPYILCHVMYGDNKGARHITRIARKMREKMKRYYRIVIVGDKEHKRLIPGYQVIYDAGPSEYLNLVTHAEYIITNSYHGTCFAINFNRRFFSVLNRNNPFNIRITDLLTMLDLENRVLFTDQHTDDFPLNDIEYERVNAILEPLRKESILFLKNSLSHCSQERI